LQDDFVGTCHAVIARIAPRVRVIDLTHGIAPQNVLQGALVLRNVLPYTPVGVHLAVVDPDVGGEGRLLVGPDNGLLVLAADREGIEAAHELSDPRFRLPDVSRTFHGRDVFAPAAAHLAAGVALDELGPAVDPATLVRLELPEARPGVATVLMIDRFGNVATNLRRDDLPPPGTRVEVRFALDRYYAFVAGTFADATRGELILYEDAYGMVTLAVSNGNAARLTGAAVGDELRIVEA